MKNRLLSIMLCFGFVQAALAELSIHNYDSRAMYVTVVFDDGAQAYTLNSTGMVNVPLGRTLKGIIFHFDSNPNLWTIQNIPYDIHTREVVLIFGLGNDEGKYSITVEGIQPLMQGNAQRYYPEEEV